MPQNAMLTRLRAEFLEMPGLRLTLNQACRLFGVDRARCQVVLEALLDQKFLTVHTNGYYARLTEGAIARRRSAKADLSAEPRVAKAS
jgi:hypothetical protein